MAIVERQATEGLQKLNGATTRRTTNTVANNTALAQVAQGSPQQDRVSNILNSLGTFVDTSSKQAYDAAQRQVELSKVQGTADAVQGIILPPEANKARELGYNLVQAQTDLSKANETLAQQAQKDPSMTDEAFNAARHAAYGEVFAKYQGQSPELQQAITTSAQESQIALTKVRVGAQQKYQQDRALEDLNYNIGSQLDSIKNPAEGARLIDEVYLPQGKALGLSETQVKDQLMEQMNLRAAQGDNRLLESIKNTKWGKFDTNTEKGNIQYKHYQEAQRQKMEAAQAKYEAKRQAELAITHGQGLAKLEVAAKSGATDAELTGMMQVLRSQGVKFTPQSVASYLTMGQQQSSEKIRITQAAAANINSGTPLAFDPNIVSGDKPKVLDRLEEEVISQGKQFQGEEQENFVTSNLIGLSQQASMPVKQLQIGLEGLKNLDPQADIPPSANVWIKQLRSMDENTLKMNASDGSFTYLSNIKDALNTAPDVRTAITRAQNLRDNKITPDASQQSRIRSKVSDAVNDQVPVAASGISGLFFNTAGLSKESLGLVKNQIQSRATNYYGLTQSVDRAANLATNEWKQNNIILGSGMSANVNPANLMSKSGIPIVKGDSPEVQQARAVSTLDYSVGQQLKAYNSSEKANATMSDTNVLFSNDGTHYQVMVNGLSVGVFNTSDLNGQFDQKRSDEWIEEQKKQIGVTTNMRAASFGSNPTEIMMNSIRKGAE